MKRHYYFSQNKCSLNKNITLGSDNCQSCVHFKETGILKNTLPGKRTWIKCKLIEKKRKKKIKFYNTFKFKIGDMVKIKDTMNFHEIIEIQLTKVKVKVGLWADKKDLTLIK
ncbi:MAG: hypothetical protein GY775_14615 [Candidatus Scalindua sp.]|nr:hypothetical protein [Candidatus Scalindua sp.]